MTTNWMNAAVMIATRTTPSTIVVPLRIPSP